MDTRQNLPAVVWIPALSSCFCMAIGYPPVSPCFCMATRLYLPVFAVLSACISLLLHSHRHVSLCCCMAIPSYISLLLNGYTRCISLWLHNHMATRQYLPAFAWLSACISLFCMAIRLYLPIVQCSLCTEYTVRGKCSLFTCQHIIFLDLIIAERGGRGGSASGLLDAVFHNCMFWCTIYLRREF